jgi:hypothetical protein
MRIPENGIFRLFFNQSGKTKLLEKSFGKYSQEKSAPDVPVFQKVSLELPKTIDKTYRFNWDKWHT